MQISAKHQWRIARMLPVLVLLAIALLAAVVAWAVVGQDDAEDTVSKPTTTAVAEEREEPENSSAQKATEGFLSSYFGRDPDLLSGSYEDRMDRLRHRLIPYATEEFLNSHLTPLDTPADKAIAKTGATVTITSVVIHGGEPDTGVPVSYVAETTLNGHVIDRVVNRLEIYPVESHGVWKINSVRELYD